MNAFQWLEVRHDDPRPYLTMGWGKFYVLQIRVGDTWQDIPIAALKPAEIRHDAMI